MVPEMQQLTPEEKVILTKSLVKFEKSAKQWISGGRYYVVAMVCLLYFGGLYGILPSAKQLLAGVDKDEIIKQLSEVPIPADVTEDYWIVGYVNKTVIREAHLNQIQLLTVFALIMGHLQLMLAVCGTIFLIFHWNDGARNLAIAKAIRQSLCKLDMI